MIDIVVVWFLDYSWKQKRLVSRWLLSLVHMIRFREGDLLDTFGSLNALRWTVKCESLFILILYLAWNYRTQTTHSHQTFRSTCDPCLANSSYMFSQTLFPRKTIDRVVWFAHPSYFSTNVDCFFATRALALVVQFGQVQTDRGMILCMNYTIRGRAVRWL